MDKMLKVVINIPEDIYRRLKAPGATNAGNTFHNTALESISNGVVLPDSDYSDDRKTCQTCKYYSYAFEGFPCVNCLRNFKLIDQIREQQNDRWKDGMIV